MLGLLRKLYSTKKSRMAAAPKSSKRSANAGPSSGTVKGRTRDNGSGASKGGSPSLGVPAKKTSIAKTAAARIGEGSNDAPAAGSSGRGREAALAGMPSGSSRGPDRSATRAAFGSDKAVKGAKRGAAEAKQDRGVVVGGAPNPSRDGQNKVATTKDKTALKPHTKGHVISKQSYICMLRVILIASR